MQYIYLKGKHCLKAITSDYISVCEQCFYHASYCEIFSCYGQVNDQNKYVHEMMLYTNIILH